MIGSYARQHTQRASAELQNHCAASQLPDSISLEIITLLRLFGYVGVDSGFVREARQRERLSSRQAVRRREVSDLRRYIRLGNSFGPTLPPGATQTSASTCFARR